MTTPTCENHTLVPATHTIQTADARRPRTVPLCAACAERASEPATAIPDAEPVCARPDCGRPESHHQPHAFRA